MITLVNRKNNNSNEEKEIVIVVDNDSNMYIEGNNWRFLFDNGFFGTLDLENKRLKLADFEVLYLFDKKKIKVYYEKEDRYIDSLKELLGILSKLNSDIWEIYLVYSDLRSRGYVIKEGISEDIIFSVYGKGDNPIEVPPKFYVFKLSEGKPISLKNLRKITQQALVSRKKLIIAVIDRQGDVTYYNVTPMVF